MAARMQKKKTVEEVYQKKTQLEHILIRPDSYIGSVEKHTEMLWVYDQGIGLNLRKVTFVPGLYKIFDEILVNAADNRQRDKNMNRMKIEIDVENSKISIWNNGQGIPIEMHKKEKVYVPELIFGHLLTSSNYDDNEKKVTGGRNGYGAKLCNIFSKEFIVETANKDIQKTYRQVFTDNMTKKKEPEIKTSKKAEDYTCITFRPDLARFGMTHLDKDMVALFTKRAYDMAGILNNVKVELNNERLGIRSFKDYVQMYINSNNEETGELPLIHEKVNDRWEVFATLSDGQFQHLSFVNAIATTKGGTHVAYVCDQMVQKLMAVVEKKNKAAPVKAFQVKNHLWVFVNCLVENPTFDSQTKETMTLRPKAFGSDCQLSDKFIKQVVASGIVERILSWAKVKQQAELKKQNGAKRSRLTGIAKLDDANMAGTRQSAKCTLILTEGDSAKALAVSGLSVVGRDYFGVFPLRGKLLNVREATHKQIRENQEIQNIVQIMGLQYNKTYTSVDQLRYGALMIMTDQDHDGSHIKGLLINFIHHFWPSLLQVPGFLVEFITPIVKATKGNTVMSFFTIPEYETWREGLGASFKNWKIKYYKGLGTSTNVEAREYFGNMNRHQIKFQWESAEDDGKIELAFSKAKVNDRKEWLYNFKQGTYLDQNIDTLTYHDFVDKELILFSMADNMRSIPSVVDGLKPGQRKILYACFKRKLKEEVKVSQLSGYVSEHSSYHHGEQSLSGTIIGMAQDFVGSNNINFLLPIGQFGTRLQGGKDAASARYIYTSLSPVARRIFHPDDDPLLNYLDDDGQSIEPDFYVPIIPTVLVNGSEGIGTGWSSSIPNYNPRDIVSNIQCLMRDEPMAPMKPWYKGFVGEIIMEDNSKYRIRGVASKADSSTLEITELPIRTWTQNYKEFLDAGLQGTEKQPAIITDFKEHHTNNIVHFSVTMANGSMLEDMKDIYKKFKLETTISTGNMVLFDSQSRIKKYSGPLEIIEEFYHLRLSLYQKRKLYLVNRLTEEYEKLDNKVRFILAVIKGDIVLSNRKLGSIIKELQDKSYKPFPKSGKVVAEADESGSENEGQTMAVPGGYDYLLDMPLRGLTYEKVKKLEGQRDAKAKELEDLLSKTPQMLWENDLKEFLQALDEQEEKERVDAVGPPKKKGPAARGGVTVGAARKRAAAKTGDAEDDWQPAKPAAAPVKRKQAAKPRAAKIAKPDTSKQVVLSSSDDDIATASLAERLEYHPVASKKAPPAKRQKKAEQGASEDKTRQRNLAEMFAKANTQPDTQPDTQPTTQTSTQSSSQSSTQSSRQASRQASKPKDKVKEISDGSESEEIEEQPTRQLPTRRGGRAVQRIQYDMDNSDSDWEP